MVNFFFMYSFLVVFLKAGKEIRYQLVWSDSNIQYKVPLSPIINISGNLSPLQFTSLVGTRP